MPAEFDVGFSVRVPAWHGLAEVLDEYPGREEAMRRAGHLWTVMEREIYLSGSEKIDGWKALARDDTYGLLCVVKDSYTPIQNSTLWDIVDAIVAQPNVHYETAGVLRKGCTLWVMARLNEPWKVPGDDTYTLPYVSVGTAHDGSHATEAMAMAVRVVCWNTYQAARDQAKRKGFYYSFRHTANVQQRLDQAREAMSAVRGQFEEFKELALELARHPVKDGAVIEFVTRFIPDPPIAEASSDRAQKFIAEARNKYIALLNGNTVADAHRRTAYGLWCAGVEFLDHVRAFRSNETYFRRTTEPSALKHQVAKLALEVAS
jgi:phage/plasmid-like protein (TIGR03299 family)